jgi:GT2 family glycosyltransferase
MIRVVIVNYESGRGLAECLASVEPLVSEGHEVVVVDNDSHDDSLEGIEERFPWLRLVRNPRNVGFATACNQGAEGFEGGALLFLNPDARLMGDAAAQLVAALEADPRLGAVAPRLFDPEGRRQFSWEPSPGLVGDTLRKLRNPFEGRVWAHEGVRRLVTAFGDCGFLTGACLMVRRAAWEQVGGFDGDYFLYFEDADLSLRLAGSGLRLAVVPTAGAEHVKGTAGAGVAGTGARRERAYREAQLRFYSKHRSPRATRALLGRLRGRLASIDDAELRARLKASYDQAQAQLDRS